MGPGRGKRAPFDPWRLFSPALQYPCSLERINLIRIVLSDAGRRGWPPKRAHLQVHSLSQPVLSLGQTCSLVQLQHPISPYITSSSPHHLPSPPSHPPPPTPPPPRPSIFLYDSSTRHAIRITVRTTSPSSTSLEGAAGAAGRISPLASLSGTFRGLPLRQQGRLFNESACRRLFRRPSVPLVTRVPPSTIHHL